MNGSVSSDPESDKSSDTSLEEESESVPPTCDALVQISNVMSEKSYEPAVPNALTRNYLQEAGMRASDPALVNLVSVVAQKFISDIAADALTHHKMRQSLGIKNKRKDKKYVMNTDDLMEALKDKGIAVRRQPYY